MVPLMIETLAKKLEDASLIPAAVIKAKVFGKQFHTICSGGAYLNPSYIDLFHKYGITILQGYGMTECSPVISNNVSWNIKKESVGQLLPNCQAKSVTESYGCGAAASCRDIIRCQRKPKRPWKEDG